MTLPTPADRDKFPYDKSSKWLIQHHGDSILRLAGLTDVASWRPLQAEVVQPRRLPDGLLEVQMAGANEADLYLLELATYPDRRVAEQIVRDTMLVYLDRGVLPETLVVVLCPKGNLRVEQEVKLHSPRGWTRHVTGIRVVELWTLPSADLLALGDPGIVPWVPLTNHEGPAEPIFQRCRAIIDKKAKPEEKENLLAVTQILARLRYNADEAKALFGGDRPMIESPLLKEIVEEAMAKGEAKGQAKAKQHDIIEFLEARFDAVSENLIASVRAIHDLKKLDDLIRLAGRSADLVAFEERMKK
jgi:predicted transposase YdaD